MTTQAFKLRERMKQGGLIVVPGCFDAISARAIERHGFDAAYMTGGGVSYSLGYPDYGLVTMTEIVGRAGAIANAVNIPLISDADTGYGNELNVTRTVREFERQGVAAIHLEDQDFPKRCGHHNDKSVIPLGEFENKIAAAAAARNSPDFVIIARTDARAVLGFDAAVDRANAAFDAGADVLFVEAPQTLEEIAAIPQRVRGPCLLNVAWNSKTPDVSLADVDSMGFRFAILPGVLLYPAIKAYDTALTEVRRDGRHAEIILDPAIVQDTRHGGNVPWERIRAGADAAKRKLTPVS